MGSAVLQCCNAQLARVVQCQPPETLMKCMLCFACRATHNGALRSYQQEALDKSKQPGNYILAAPTGMQILLSTLCKVCVAVHSALQLSSPHQSSS